MGRPHFRVPCAQIFGHIHFVDVALTESDFSSVNGLANQTTKTTLTQLDMLS